MRKFLRPKITDEARRIVEFLEMMKPLTEKDYDKIFTNEEIDLIIQSLYKTEIVYEMEPRL